MQRCLVSTPTASRTADKALPDHVIDRQSWLAATALLVLAGLVFIMAGGLRLGERRDCQLHSQWLRTQPGQETNAKSRNGAPCLISVRNTHPHAEAIEIVNQPQNGRIDMRGKTALIYVPNPRFRGQDSFDFRVLEKGTPKTTAGLVSMKINVDR